MADAAGARVSAAGPALGLLPEWTGRTQRWHMAPGDALLLYTDGVLDAKISPSERLDEERLLALLRGDGPQEAAGWIDRLRRGLEGCLEWPDDVTAVAVSRAPVSHTTHRR